MVWRRARRLRWRASRAGDKETDTRLDGEVGWLGPIVAAANCCARIRSQVGRREQLARRCHLLSSILITVELRVLRNFAFAQFRISTRVLRQAAVARALLIVLTQVADS